MEASFASHRTVCRENFLRCHEQQVLVCSTGVIGVPLPVERILKAVRWGSLNRLKILWKRSAVLPVRS